MISRRIWVFLLVQFAWSLRAEASPSLAFHEPWLLTEDEPAEWARHPELVNPEHLGGWQPYHEPRDSQDS
jgi:hypothetical protein